MSKSTMSKDIPFFSSVTTEELTKMSGVISVPTTNKIERGRATVRVDLREGLTNKNFTGFFEDCTAEFDDFEGKLDISCSLSSDVVNGGQVLFLAPVSTS